MGDDAPQPELVPSPAATAAQMAAQAGQGDFEGEGVAKMVELAESVPLDDGERLAVALAAADALADALAAVVALALALALAVGDSVQ